MPTLAFRGLTLLSGDGLAPKLGHLARQLWDRPGRTRMRLTACMQLRVKDVDFQLGAIIVRTGKGGKDRVLEFPVSRVPELRNQ